MFSAVGGGGSTSIVIAVSGDGAACAGWNINAGEADWGDQMLEIRSDYESYQGFMGGLCLNLIRPIEL